MISRVLLKEARKKIAFFILTILLGLGIGLAIIYQARLLSNMISAVFLEHSSLENVRIEIIALVFVILLRSCFIFFRELASGEVSSAVMFDLRNRLFMKIMNFGPVNVGSEQTGELTNVIFQGVEKLDVYFREYLPQLVLAVSIPVLVLIVVFPVDLLTGIIFFVTAPLIPLFMVLIGRQADKETNRQWKLLSLLSGHYFDILQGLETLKNFGLSKKKEKDIEASSEQYASITLQVLRIAFLSAFVLEILATISTAVVAVQIGLRLLYGRMMFSDGLFLLILAPEFYFPLRQLGASFHAGREGVASAERIFSILGKQDENEQVAPGTSRIIQFKKKIEFLGVTYKYTGRESPSVTDLNFSIEAGEQVALVGKSGSGKSTVAALLIGFISALGGEIRIDGNVLSNSNIRGWRENIAFIPQFPYLFNGSIEENLRIAKENATWDEIKKAVSLANAEEFILRLPDGYQTVVGENAAKLSRGQAQRLAISRAFLRAAPLLVVDEPFASLDSQNDQKLVSALQTLRESRTALIVAHRLSTVVKANKIIVLEEGRISQMGTHEQLVRTEGKYSELLDYAWGNL